MALREGLGKEEDSISSQQLHLNIIKLEIVGVTYRSVCKARNCWIELLESITAWLLRYESNLTKYGY